MLEAILYFLYRFRAIVCPLGIAAMLAGGWLASTLAVNDSPERWLPASSNQDWARFSEHFGYGDTVAIAVEFHRTLRDDDIKLFEGLRKDFLAIPEVGRVIDASLVADQIEQVPLTKLVSLPKEGEDDVFSLYRGALFDDSEVWREDKVTPENQLDRRTFVCFVELKPEEELTPTAANAPSDPAAQPERYDTDEMNAHRRAAIAGIRQALANHRRDDVTFHMLGGIAVQHELESIAHKIAVTFLPLSLVLTLLSIGVVFRSLTAVAIVVLGAAWSVAIMLGGVALAGWTLNVVTVGGPTLMAVTIIVAAVHFAQYYSEALEQHQSHEGAPRSGIADVTSGSITPERHFVRWVAVPCLGAAATTGIGFLMLAFNELGPMREFGIELCAGAFLAFFGAFLAWMLLHPFRAVPGKWLSAQNLLRMQSAVIVWPRTTVALLMGLIVALTWTSQWVRVDADPFSFFQEDSDIAKAFDHFSTRKFGLYNLDVVLVPKNHPIDPMELLETRKADRNAAQQFEASLKDRPEVRNTLSAVSLGTRQRTLQLQLSFAGMRRFLAFQDTFRNWTYDRKQQDAIRVTFLVYDPGTGFRPLVDAMRAQLPTDRFDCFYTGAAANVATLSEGLVGGMARGLIAGLIVMAVLCLVLFRSLKLTLLAIPPNIFPIVLIFGVMGALDLPLNSGSAMVATIALGVALNDTIHFLMHYRRVRSTGVDAHTCLTESFGELGRPIVLTSVVNCVGFGIFLLSDFRPLADFGLLAGISMVAALIGDLILLPNLLCVFDAAFAPTAEAPLPDANQEVAV